MFALARLLCNIYPDDTDQIVPDLGKLEANLIGDQLETQATLADTMVSNSDEMTSMFDLNNMQEPNIKAFCDMITDLGIGYDKNSAEPKLMYSGKFTRKH